MINYNNLSNRDRQHLVELTLQSGEFKGTIIQCIGGNCLGYDILTSLDPSEFSEDETFYGNDCNLQIEENCGEYFFTCVLKNNDGEKCEISDFIEELPHLVVKLEIIECLEVSTNEGDD